MLLDCAFKTGGLFFSILICLIKEVKSYSSFHLLLLIKHTLNTTRLYLYAYSHTHLLQIKWIKLEY